MPNPGIFSHGLSTHESGPRAGDIGYPQWFGAIVSKPPAPFGPSLEGIELLSRTIMTGKIFFGNS